MLPVRGEIIVICSVALEQRFGFLPSLGRLLDVLGDAARVVAVVDPHAPDGALEAHIHLRPAIHRHVTDGSVRPVEERAPNHGRHRAKRRAITRAAPGAARFLAAAVAPSRAHGATSAVAASTAASASYTAI